MENKRPIIGISMGDPFGNGPEITATTLNGWISKEEVLEVYELLKKNQYGQYLKDVLDGKYLDALR